MGRSGVHGVRDPEREIVSSRFHYVLKKVKTLPVVTHKDIGYGVLHVPIKLTSIFREFLDHGINISSTGWIPEYAKETSRCCIVCRCYTPFIFKQKQTLSGKKKHTAL